MKTKAFSYLRVSGKGQIQGDGFPRQREVIKRYVAKHQMEIVQEFRDEGVSGTKDAFDRPGLTELFVILKANGVRMVLVERADRLARDLMVGEIILAEFRKIGVKVISAECGTDLTVEDNDPTRKLIRQVLGAVSEFEKSCIVQKLRAARVRIRSNQGRCEGRKPYGVTPDERDVIARMRKWQKQNLTIIQIAQRLNAEGICPRTELRNGKQTHWHATTVQRILARKQ
jgi:DNA invertase Pin-like site-specific DNA recombinase